MGKLFVLTLLSVATAFGQGSLTPPAPPAPTMKTLAQIEPRTLITNLPYTINSPGSYYVATNLTGNPDGITIAANGVTLDLTGFELVGGTNWGISVSGIRSNIVIRNGTVRGWVFGGGISLAGSRNCRCERLTIVSNLDGLLVGPDSVLENCTAVSHVGVGLSAGEGCTVKDSIARLNNIGITAGTGSRVVGCSVSTNGSDGMQMGDGGIVQDCVSRNNAGKGIVLGNGCSVKDCAVSGNSNNGIQAGSGNLIANCAVSGNSSNGISADHGNTIVGCTVRLNGMNGIKVLNSNLIKGNVCDNNGGGPIPVPVWAGIYVDNFNVWNRIEDNSVTYNPYGIYLLGATNVVVRNTLGGNSNPRQGPNGTFYGGPIQASHLVSGFFMTNLNPWANFELGGP